MLHGYTGRPCVVDECGHAPRIVYVVVSRQEQSDLYPTRSILDTTSVV
jgi:hypothetical protein